MTKERKGFWRNFTWKRFVKFSIILLLYNFIFKITWDYFDPAISAFEGLTFNEILKTTGKSILIGLLVTIWLDPVRKPG